MGASDEQWTEKRTGEDRRASVTEDAFLATLGAIRDEVRSARAEASGALAEASGANKRSGRAVLVAIVAVVGAVLGGVNARTNANNTKAIAHTVQQQQADRDAARLGACLNNNKERAQTRSAIVTTADKSVLAVLPANPSPDQAARTQTFLAAYHAGAVDGVTAGLPDRDCSPAAIERYYNPPTTTTTVKEKTP